MFNEKKFWTAEELAKTFHCCEATIYMLSKKKNNPLKATRISKRIILFSSIDIERYLEGQSLSA